ncbi:hypothetical protein [Sulfurospirillum sp. 1612]|uniref:hypothetical protein n=1 Tax=Sulfurospirillum sp. 1612 TaxID=3094835 RepID=UPI002F95048F
MFQKIILSLAFSTIMMAQNCVQCHKKEVQNYQHNLHYTLSKAINITREAWGVKDSNVTFQTLPQAKKDIKNPSDLVDDFLRRKCLKCHIDSKTNIKDSGIKRGVSCLACHEPHQTSGKCQRDKISMDKCLSCHNKNYVGGDYQGLFPKDEEASYRAPLRQNGYFPEVKYGIDYHHLQSDVHFQKGMTCVSCHTAKDMHEGKKVSCKDCHKNPSAKNHPAYHDNISCSACHASWNNSSYELSVFRDDMADYAKWKKLTLQEDEYLSNFLHRALRSKEQIKPLMPDWVSGGLKKGVWYSGYRYRRWEDVVLGNSDEGKIEILRPLYQYRISYRDANGTMILDDVRNANGQKTEAWIPYSPHTITKHAKSCERCHDNPLITHPYRGDNAILKLKVPMRFIGATALTKEQIAKMRSSKYKQIRAKMIFSEQF